VVVHPEPRAGERAEVKRQHVHRDPDVPHRRPRKPEVRVPRWRGQRRRDIIVTTGMITDDVVAKEPGIRPDSRRRHGEDDRNPPPDVRRIVAGEATYGGRDEDVQRTYEDRGERQAVGEGAREGCVEAVTALEEPGGQRHRQR